MVNSRVFAVGFRDVDLAVRVLVLAEAAETRPPRPSRASQASWPVPLFGVRCVKLLLARGDVLVVGHQLNPIIRSTSSRAPIRRPIGLRHTLRWRPCVIPDRSGVGAGEVSELLVDSRGAAPR